MDELITKESPKYTVIIIDGDTTYYINPMLISIELSENENEMAQKAVLTVDNIQINNVWSTSIFHVRQRVFIYADDGVNKDEVFRGYIWETGYTSSNTTRDFVLTCYDDLVFLIKSEDYVYMSSGKETKDIFEKIGEDFEKAYAVPGVRIGNALVRLMYQRELVDFAVKWMETNRA